MAGVLSGCLSGPFRVGAETCAETEAETDSGEFDGYRQRGRRWRGERDGIGD